MTEIRVVISDASAAEGNRLVPKLQDSLVGIPNLKAEVLRERQDTQDAGAILSIILAGPAIIAAVKAMAGWLARNNQSAIDITLPNGTVVIKNMKSEDVPKAIAALEKVVSGGK